MKPYLLRFFILAGACLCAAPFTWTQTRPNTETAPAISPDEQQIRQSVVKYVELYNAHQSAALAELYAADARMVFRDGTEINGREEIAKAIDANFTEFPKSALSVVVDSIRFLTPEVAVEEGTTSDFPDGETLAARSRYTILHVKKNGQWSMQSIRVQEEESTSAYRELQPLEWLVGEWIDEGRTENVETTFRWDDNKAFLLEEFQVVRSGSVVLRGSQRIGWDAQAKQIRSWIFDNAGGFSEATWTNVDGVWISKAKGVSAEGVSTSATRILEQAASNRVLCTLKDRLAGNEALPAVTVTMVRKPPAPKN
jgi:uncharacterized protein (TIGR02246 family)